MARGASTKTKKVPRPKTLQRAKSSFFLYCDEARKVAKQNNPSMTMSDVSRLISQQWASLSPEEKTPYVELAKVKKAEFEASRPALAPKSSQRLPSGFKRAIDVSTGCICYIHGPSRTMYWERPSAATKVPFVPRKAKNGYNVFAARAKSREPKKTLAEVAELWKCIDAAEKAECERLAAQDRVRYETEMLEGKLSVP